MVLTKHRGFTRFAHRAPSSRLSPSAGRWATGRWVTALIIGGAFLVSALPAAGGEVQTLPEAPTLLPDVHNFEVVEVGGQDVYQFTNPYIPPLTNSQDHRIGLVRKRAGSNNNKAVFHLLVPEQLTDELLLAGAGATILDDFAFEIEADDLHQSPTGNLATHFALCDPLGATAQITGPNPYICNGDRECYKLYVIATVHLPSGGPNGEDQVQMWRTPIIIEVENPKTASAKIAGITLDALPTAGPKLGDTGTGIRSWHTPMIVGDNRLLVTRISPSTITWYDANNVARTGTYDTVYASYSGGEECDISQWTNLKPLAYAPSDPAVNSPTSGFGFAQYEYRTPSGAAVNSDPTQGTLIDIPGRYIWMDQAANNIFFATLDRKLIDEDSDCLNAPFNCQHLYDLACVPGTSCSDPYDPAAESSSDHQGWMMMGLWTHGKMVLLDSLVNHSDFGLEGEEEHHRMVSLFSDADVRVGTGRDASVIRTSAGADSDAYGWIRTTVQFGSLEHFFNMVPEMQPRTARDVAWLITAGAQTDEISFDDYTSFRTLIFSPMNALKEMVPPKTYYDGNAGTDMRLQNAATSLKWNVPSYGDVVVPSVGGDDKGRIENVALGGIKARGFHLDPVTRIDYLIPSQEPGAPDPTQQEWLVSLFLDRTDTSWGELRRMVNFPSGAFIDLFGLSKLKACPSGLGGCPTVTLPKPIYHRGWTHLGFHLNPNTGKLRFFQDGFLFAEVNLPSGMEIEPGTLSVGSPNQGTTLGVGGWIDEFKVVEGPFTFEEVCNHARGTLVAVPHTYDALPGNALADLLAPFNAAAGNANAESGRDAVHQALYGPGAQASSFSDYYVCNIDYTDPRGVSVNDPGDSAARSIRRRLLFPEGPLVWDQYRPDSLANNFCGACHRDEEAGGLTLAALTFDPTDVAEDDPRRQPMQPPAMMVGHVPAGYIAPGKPASDQEDPKIDRWIDDGPLYRWTFDEAAGTSVANWVIGDPQAVSNGDSFAGTLFGAAFEPGETRGHALELDAGNDGSGDKFDYALIDTNVDVAGDAMTLATWFRLGVDGMSPSAPEDQCTNFVNGKWPCTLVAKSANTNHDFDWGLRLFYRPNDLQPKWQAQWMVKAGGSLQTLTVELDGFDSSAWHHLAGTFDDGEMELFLDGASIGTLSVGSSSLTVDPTHEVTLGSRLSTGGAPLHPYYGLLDDVRIYGRALLDAEITDLYNNTP